MRAEGATVATQIILLSDDIPSKSEFGWAIKLDDSIHSNWNAYSMMPYLFQTASQNKDEHICTV